MAAGEGSGSSHPNNSNIMWTSGVMDYGPCGGFVGGFNNTYMKPGPRSGGGRRGVLNDDNLFMPIRNITDGTSNTLFLAEMGGRENLWQKGKLIASYTPPTAAGAAVNAGFGWADHNNAENWLSGSLADGTGSAGPCLINCTNAQGKGTYSFHTGGVHVVLCDGSVRFISENIDYMTMVNLITYGDNEVIGDF